MDRQKHGYSNIEGERAALGGAKEVRMKGIVVYDSKYGNCRKVAEEIAAGMAEAGAEATAVNVKQVDTSSLASYDAIAVGSPVWAGKPFRKIRNFVTGLGTAAEGKKLAFFETYGVEKAGPGQGTKKLEEIARKAAPGAKLMSPGFSGIVTKMKGPLADDVLPQAKEFGKKMVQA
jgi:flavodoxin